MSFADEDTGQLGLFDPALRVELTEAERSFREWHDTNPHIYERLVYHARRLKAAGQTRAGVALIFEVVRYEHMTRVHKPEGEEFKLNNNYRSRYARLIMEREADLGGFFEVRELKS
jgi:hypothetical protein